YFTVHGNLPAASGWISRADSLLESAGPCPEAGWLALIKSAMTTDTDAMKSLAQQAIDLGRSFRDHDLEIVGVSALGLARVYATELASGMAALDEAMAAASGGELRSFFALSDVYCNTLIACERAADLRLRQGRIEEAARLLEGLEENRLALRATVRLRMAQGQTPVAARMLRGRLEQVGAASLLAVPLLALLVEVQLTIGNVDSARETANNITR